MGSKSVKAVLILLVGIAISAVIGFIKYQNGSSSVYESMLVSGAYGAALGFPTAIVLVLGVGKGRRHDS